MNNERIHANNAKFREANETIYGRAAELGVDMPRIPFLCECALEECVQVVQLTSAEYSAVREHPDHYMTAVGHEAAERPVATIVARHDGYVVVEKDGK